MSNISTYPLRLPKSLKTLVAQAAKSDSTSINQFINIAVAEKISALDTENFFNERTSKFNNEHFKDILFRKGGETPRAGDELS